MGRFDPMYKVVLQEVHKYLIPLPKIFYNTEDDILHFAWPSQELEIIIHEEGIILSDGRSPGENILEFNLSDLVAVVNYQLQKLSCRINVSDTQSQCL